MTSVSVDTSGAIKKTKAVRTGIRSMFGSAGYTSGKMAAFFCHQYTLPTSHKGSDWNFAKMAGRIESDVESAYGSKDDSNWEGSAYILIRDSLGEDKAKAWWRTFKSRYASTFDADAAHVLDHERQFDKMRLPAGSRVAKEKQYLQYRKANGYSVPRGKDANRKVLGIVSSSARQKLIDSRKKTMGLAKAGWKACYHALGGSGLKISTMGGVSRKWPSQINVPYRKFGGKSLGSGSVKLITSGFYGEITNNVNYMDDAFQDWGRERVNGLTKRYMKIVFDLRRKHMARAVSKRQSAAIATKQAA